MKSSSNKARVFETFAREFRDQVGPAFPLSEYQDRWRRVREQMERDGLQGLWVSTPADMCYLTGFETAWFHDLGPADWVAESGVFMHVDLDQPISFDDEDEELLHHGLAHPGELSIVPNQFAEGLTDGERKAAGEAGFSAAIDFIIDRIGDAGGLRGKIGLQTGSYRPSRAYSELLESRFRAAGADIGDGTDTVAKVSLIKSPAELEKAREAAAIGDAGMAAIVERMEEGATELQLWAAATSAMADLGGELSAIPGIVGSGPKSGSLHGYVGRRALRAGDLVNADLCGVVDRYHSNLGRCFSLGEPDPGTRDAIDRVTEVARQVMAEMRTGMSFRELLDLNVRAASKAGILEDAWWIGGYDLGIAFPPDWAGRFAFVADEDPGDAILEPGMVMDHEWIFYLPDGAGVRELCDTFLVTEDGVEFPHRFPLDLIVAG